MGTALATVSVTTPKIPKQLVLEQNYPNPVSGASSGTRIAFQLPASSRVRLDIYDIAGRRVRALVDANMGAGARSAFWDGRDDAGRRVASGVYLYRLEATGKVLAKRLVIVR
jgi:flagellar hook assembly protein FlgD